MQNYGIGMIPGGAYAGTTLPGQHGVPSSHLMSSFAQPGGGQVALQHKAPMGVPALMGSHMGVQMNPIAANIGQMPRPLGSPPASVAAGGSNAHIPTQFGPGRNAGGLLSQSPMSRNSFAVEGPKVAGTPGRGSTTMKSGYPIDDRQSLGSPPDTNQFGASKTSFSTSQNFDGRDVVYSGSRGIGSHGTVGTGVGQLGQTQEGLLREASFNPGRGPIACRVLVRDPRTGAFVPSADAESDHTPSSQVSSAAPQVNSTGRQSSQTPGQTGLDREALSTNRPTSLNSRRLEKPAENTEAAPARQEPEVLREAKTDLPKESGEATPSKKKYVRPHLPNTVPTKEGVEHLEPNEVFEMLKDEACMLVDVRGADRSAGLIDGAVHVPAIAKVMFPSRVPDLIKCFAQESLVVFTCQYSAHRAPQCANWYREKAPRCQRVAILAGGFRAWEANGLPVTMPAAGKDDDKAADAFAMKQGVAFVKKHAPEVYQRAKQQQQQEQPQEQPQDQEKAQSQQEPQPTAPQQTPTDSRHPSKKAEMAKVDQDTKTTDDPSKQSEWMQRKSHQQQQTLQLQQQQEQLRHQLHQLQQQQQHRLERQQQQLLQQQRLQHHLQQQAHEMQDRPGASPIDTSMPQRQQRDAHQGHAPNTVPLVTGVEVLEPMHVYHSLYGGECVLVDVRGDDRAAGLIAGAYHVPAIGEPMFPTRLPDLLRTFANESLVVFFCQFSAHRGPQCANWYREQASPRQRVAVLAGGFRGWEAAGLPVALPVANPNEA